MHHRAVCVVRAAFASDRRPTYADPDPDPGSPRPAQVHPYRYIPLSFGNRFLYSAANCPIRCRDSAAASDTPDAGCRSFETPIPCRWMSDSPGAHQAFATGDFVRDFRVIFAILRACRFSETGARQIGTIADLSSLRPLAYPNHGDPHPSVQYSGGMHGQNTQMIATDICIFFFAYPSGVLPDRLTPFETHSRAPAVLPLSCVGACR
ncbi:hypothetical protein DFH07DRAFT_801717 [Mycena maculata]|uniref:Uncharacterized protein n=1 Tax=Mycena maculata TaxID=230809 RepID=A0AAD7JVR1_9AGAR|nr:hypothetical protein DFH07DRAFT_801717 [Mycena maculata]